MMAWREPRARVGCRHRPRRPESVSLGESIRFGRVMYCHRIPRGTLCEGAYGGLSLEAGRVGEPLVPGNPDALLKSMCVFVAADTLVGPIYRAYRRAAAGDRSFHF